MSVVMVTTKKSETSSSSGPVATSSTASANLSANSVPVQQQNSSINTTMTTSKSTSTASSTNTTSINAPSFVFEPYDPSTSSEGPSNSNNTSCSGASALNVGGTMEVLDGDVLLPTTAAKEDSGVVVASYTGHHDNNLSCTMLYKEQTRNGSDGLCTVSPHVIFGRMHSEPERPLPLIEFASLQPPVELQTLSNPSHRSCPEISPESPSEQQMQHQPHQHYLHQHSFTSSRSGGPADPSMSIESTGSGGVYRGLMCGGNAAAAASYHRCSISNASTGSRLCASPRVKRHLWPSHARSVLSSRLEHSFLTRTVSRESMRLSTHALNSGFSGSYCPHSVEASGRGDGNNKSRTSSCSEQPLMAAERQWLQGRAGQADGNYLNQHLSPQHGLTCSGTTGHYRSAAASGGPASAFCSASGCPYHLGSSSTSTAAGQAHLAHRPSLLVDRENEIAEIAADSMRINGALRQFPFRQLRKATNASTLSMPVAEKGSFTAANSLEVTADASTPLMNATSDHRTPQQFLSQRSFASNSLDSEKKKSTTIKSGLIKPVGYRLGRRKGTCHFLTSHSSH